MKSFFKGHKIYLPIIIMIICLLSSYAYNASFEATPAVSRATDPVDKVDRFNSLVPGVFILNGDGADYSAIGAIFSSVGYDVMEGSLEDYKKLGEGNYIFLIPEKEAEKLGDEDSEYIAGRIYGGQNIITWGKSVMNESFGITLLNNNEDISGYTWNDMSGTPINFKKPSSLGLFSFKGGFKVLAEDKDKNPVMVSGSYGKGNVIYSGIPLIDSSGQSYEHFPFIMEAVKGQFGMKPAFARNDLAIYVDIDYHVKERPAEIAERIRSYGANQINLSAWYSMEKYGDVYREIIEECHKRGISVFAWFELPYVSDEFWDKHPEWREKTASGEDAHIDWRRLMALSNPEALKEIKKYMSDFIRSYDWDGVDIAEIYFESPGEGFEGKDKFTPMNDSFRRSFQDRYGVDPRKAFDVFSKYNWKYNRKMKQNIVDYRVELITKLHEEFLLLCEELKKEKPYLQTSVTVIDSIADKNMRENIGVDAEAISKLQDRYHFMLQIEDPYTLWSLGPDRYEVIGGEYRSKMPAGNRLAIDINVVNRGGEVYPTRKQRGVELYQLINNASRYTDKVILYALATFEKADMELVPYATGTDVDVGEISKNEYLVKAGKRFIWDTETAGKTYYIDGEKWPFVSEKGVIIPGGEHRLEVQDKENSSKLFVESVNGEVADVSRDKGISFSYSSEGRFYMVINNKPSKIIIDGSVSNYEIKENRDDYTVVLPEGRHKVSLY